MQDLVKYFAKYLSAKKIQKRRRLFIGHYGFPYSCQIPNAKFGIILQNAVNHAWKKQNKIKCIITIDISKLEYGQQTN